MELDGCLMIDEEKEKKKKEEGRFTYFQFPYCRNFPVEV